MIFGPSYAEMRDPSRIETQTRRAAAEARGRAPLDPVNLFNITWKDERGVVDHLVLPKELTGVDAPIAVISGRRFPTGAHKVGAVYAILLEKQLAGEVTPGEHTIVCPSTGNYGIGGAWVGPRMGYRSLVVLPEEMSAERFEMIKRYGAQVIATPGCESNVKEIFDKVWELRRDPKNRILEQFSEFGNYRFHYEVTGNSVADLAKDLATRGVGKGTVSAFVSAMGSAGTIAAGDRLKQIFGTCIVGLEPVQCPTLYSVGFGGHRIEGIGDKHVTWIHNVLNMDYLLCIDDRECLEGLQLVQEGTEVLIAEGVPSESARSLVGFFGVSGICNVLGAIKTARLLGLNRRDLVVTVATDSFDRYPSVLAKLDAETGRMTAEKARRRIDIFRNVKLDWILEGSRSVRQRWHNQKYFTWVEQQGKTTAQLQEQSTPEFWLGHQAMISDIDRQLASRRS
jgi:cysteine synthase